MMCKNAYQVGRNSYLCSVQMGAGLGSTAPEAERRPAMTNLLNRILDLSVSFAVLGLTLTIAGATAGLGV